MVVCAISNLVYLMYNVCACLLDKGSEDIQVLPNGLAFITSVRYGGRLCWLLITRCYIKVDDDDDDDNRLQCQHNRRLRRYRRPRQFEKC